MPSLRVPVELQEPLSVQLTSLSLRMYASGADHACVAALLTASAPSLRTLWLHTSIPTTTQPLTNTLKTIHLPNLTELGISCRYGFDAMLAFYKRHASQLEKLTFVAEDESIDDRVADQDQC